MPIVLLETNVEAKITKYGAETIEISSEEWLNIRYGTPETPIDDLLIQTPIGKKWVVTYTVYIEETDV